jgi:hypothetical protein
MTGPGRHDRDCGNWCHLVLTRSAAKLQAGLVELEAPVQSAGGELPTPRVDGELPVTGDSSAALNELGRLAAATDTTYGGSMSGSHR